MRTEYDENQVYETQSGAKMNINLYSTLFSIMRNIPWLAKEKEVNMNGRVAYNYASESQFVAAVRPLMIEFGLLILPIHCNHNQETHPGKDGKTTFSSSVDMKYRFIDIKSGESLEVSMTGVGMDNGDKAIYKALTGAFRTMLRQSFMIGTGEDPEAGEQRIIETSSVIADAIEELIENDVSWDVSYSNAMRLKGYVFAQENTTETKKTADAILSLIGHSDESIMEAIKAL